MAVFDGGSQGQGETSYVTLADVAEVEEKSNTKCHKRLEKKCMKIYPETRTIKLKRGRSFGFRVRGQVTEGGPRWLINGNVYPCLQTISAVLENTPADDAGIQVGDRILEINGENVIGAEHEQIVQLVSQGGQELEIKLITPYEAKMIDIPLKSTVHGHGSSKAKQKIIQKAKYLDESHLEEKEFDEDESSIFKDTNDDEAITEVIAEIITQVEEIIIKEEANMTTDVIEQSQSESLLIDMTDDSNDAETVAETVAEVIAVIITQVEKSAVNETSEIITEEEASMPMDVTEQSETLSIDKTEEECGNISESEVYNESQFVCYTATSNEVKNFLDSRERSHQTKDKHMLKLRKQMKRGTRIIPNFKMKPFTPSILNDLSPYYSRHMVNSMTNYGALDGNLWVANGFRATAQTVVDPMESLRMDMQLQFRPRSQGRISNHLSRSQSSRDLELLHKALSDCRYNMVIHEHIHHSLPKLKLDELKRFSVQSKTKLTKTVTAYICNSKVSFEAVDLFTKQHQTSEPIPVET